MFMAVTFVVMSSNEYFAAATWTLADAMATRHLE
jgi:hypothetical protein